MYINNNFIRFKSKDDWITSSPMERLVGYLIYCNKSIIIGSENPKERLKILQERFPEARFELCGMGVKLCSK